MMQNTRALPRKRLSLFQIVLILAVLGFAAWYIYITVAPKASPYATIQAGTLGAHYSGQALIVRNETPYVAEGVTHIEYTAQEGETCARGMEICNVYSSGYSSKDMTTLQDYRDQIRDYERKLISSSKNYDARMERMEKDVVTRAYEIREILSGSRGNLTTQTELLKAAMTARQQYIRLVYADDQRLSRLVEDETNQKKNIEAQKRQHVATKETIVSFYSDGYEFGLTMMNYNDYTPAQVRHMINGNRPETSQTQKNKETIYRTIEDDGYAVLFLVNDTSWNPVEGQTYELQLEQYDDTLVTGVVESCTRSGGELLVRLRVNDRVKPVLYMRTCQATLGDYLETLRVPARAIYKQDGMTGVVLAQNGQEMFIPVQLIYNAGDYVYITPVTYGLLQVGQTVMVF